MSIMPKNDNAAACGTSPRELWRVTGTGVRDAGRSAHCAKPEANACRLERNCHKMPVPGRVAGCERSGLQFSRRTVAAPSRGVFLFWRLFNSWRYCVRSLYGRTAREPFGVAVS